MQEQVEDQDLAGLARPRTVVARPTASVDATVLAPVPAPLDCPYLHLDDDGPSCLALAPAIRLARRQVEVVCAVTAHVACPRLIKADAGRLPVQIEPPPALARRPPRPPSEATDPAGLAGSGFAASALAATAIDTTAADADAGAAASAAAATNAATAAAAETAAPAGPAPGAPARPATTVPEPESRPAEAAVRAARAPATGHTTPAPAAGVPVSSRLADVLSLVRTTARTHIVLRPVTAAAWVLLLGTLVIVIALLTARGGLTLPAVATQSPGVAGASPTAASASPSPAASPSATVAPTAPSSPSPSAVSTPSGAPTPSAGSPFTPEQLAVLTACPGKPGCYQYRIKSGDNLHNLATFFGVTYPALLAANPQITNPSVIHVGQRVTIPLPVPTPSASPKA